MPFILYRLYCTHCIACVGTIWYHLQLAMYGTLCIEAYSIQYVSFGTMKYMILFHLNTLKAYGVRHIDTE